ncbi:MAG: hypothetical protein JNM46_03815 [Anaerolineales bacterium]|nr:hypothetical protein [Anaerolineales bacterium]
MFDNLREESSKDFDEQAKFQPAAGTRRTGGRSGRFLGMTSIQRFVIVLLIMFTVCVLGTLCLLATQRIMF